MGENRNGGERVLPSSIVETLKTFSEGETISLAREFARRLVAGDVVALYGELGAGKTQFVKGVCLGLGLVEVVTSPSFIIMNEYKYARNGGESLSVYHFDFYRIKSISEVYDLGIEEYFYGKGICLIEWADAAGPLLPPSRYDIILNILSGGNEREIRIEQLGS